ncbi:tRNA (adenosine(37)-N6)-threonylcarbamoyltransferase complex dimerization subunit type 1 TsaB [Sandaracinobacter neustonicus]|uniref:tRNA (Adenosine(37)-N6)-threonylcarbamoyltransferase complex dimerization subunit type 1 TsaB n=1 Tax=Sandaracinobacter neustonicus TaxID=1715348 RepID=A0A501XT73_9SPHN|nr:tRNA (adenosine(37)-N6)-threonylcarbamoyltransferase complex dimerization subunit type 1 TsaB [Sandaracinobacter neustonicus]TPE63982.1 tRNA (adenosine(37)-N6)-threonylcarbamoyltransferase complex dimerization subunit type 1 TsaB [Sandaracinobacter neustonicus]
MPDRLTGRTLVIATGHDLSLALLQDGRLLAHRDQAMVKGHAEALVPAIAELLAPFGGPACRPEHVVVETGPGSFTGLRVGLAAARALALAWGASLFGVRSTQLAAATAPNDGRLLVVLEAPRGQIWAEGFEGAGRRTILPPVAISPDEAAGLANGYDHVAGSAPALMRDGVAAQPPRAAALAQLEPGALGAAELLYVRAAEPA